MKTIEEMVAVMQAYIDGKKIESKYQDEVWEDCSDPAWEWGEFDYRIKPEQEYRPYANADECFADVKGHGMFVKAKMVDKIYVVICAITDNAIFLGGESFAISMAELLRGYVWEDDGTPCGVLEGE